LRSVTLGSIAKVVSGGTPDRNTSAYWGGDIPWIKTGAINYSTITEASEWITEAGLRNSAARILPKGTILMAMYGQGKTRAQVATLGIDAAINQACAAILLKEGVESSYIFQQLWFRYWAIRNLSNVGNQENLSSGLIRGIKIPIPKIEEQRRIAKILQAWDVAMENQRSLIEEKKRLLGSMINGYLASTRPAARGEGELCLGQVLRV